MNVMPDGDEYTLTVQSVFVSVDSVQLADTVSVPRPVCMSVLIARRCAPARNSHWLSVLSTRALQFAHSSYSRMQRARRHRL